MILERMVKGKIVGRLHGNSAGGAELPIATFDPATSHTVMRAATAI
jgi:hypothetical protein